MLRIWQWAALLYMAMLQSDTAMRGNPDTTAVWCCSSEACCLLYATGYATGQCLPVYCSMFHWLGHMLRVCCMREPLADGCMQWHQQVLAPRRMHGAIAFQPRQQRLSLGLYMLHVYTANVTFRPDAPCLQSACTTLHGKGPTCGRPVQMLLPCLHKIMLLA